MAEVDAYAYATNGTNSPATAGNLIETQQPGGSGALRQTMVIGDPTTRANVAGVDSTGNLKVTNRVQTLGATVGSITTASSVVTATTDVSNAGAITVVVGGTYAGVNISFEASVDNSTWVGILAQRTDSYYTEKTSGVLAANTIRAWDIPLPGFAYFRVRATAWTSGSAAIAIAPAVNAFEIAPTVGLAPGGFGWTPYFANALVAPAGGVTISAVSGKFGGYMLQNLNSTPAYLQCFDTTATVTLGTTTPTFVIPIPANSTAANGVAANVEFTIGVTLNNGLKVAATTTATGATAVTTGLTGLIMYT